MKMIFKLALCIILSAILPTIEGEAFSGSEDDPFPPQNTCESCRLADKWLHKTLLSNDTRDRVEMWLFIGCDKLYDSDTEKIESCKKISSFIPALLQLLSDLSNNFCDNLKICPSPKEPEKQCEGSDCVKDHLYFLNRYEPELRIEQDWRESLRKVCKDDPLFTAEECRKYIKSQGGIIEDDIVRSFVKTDTVQDDDHTSVAGVKDCRSYLVDRTSRDRNIQETLRIRAERDLKTFSIKLKFHPKPENITFRDADVRRIPGVRGHSYKITPQASFHGLKKGELLNLTFKFSYKRNEPKITYISFFDGSEKRELCEKSFKQTDEQEEPMFLFEAIADTAATNTVKEDSRKCEACQSLAQLLQKIGRSMKGTSGTKQFETAICTPLALVPGMQDYCKSIIEKIAETGGKNISIEDIVEKKLNPKQLCGATLGICSVKAPPTFIPPLTTAATISPFSTQPWKPVTPSTLPTMRTTTTTGQPWVPVTTSYQPPAIPTVGSRQDEDGQFSTGRVDVTTVSPAAKEIVSPLPSVTASPAAADTNSSSSKRETFLSSPGSGFLLMISSLCLGFCFVIAYFAGVRFLTRQRSYNQFINESDI